MIDLSNRLSKQEAVLEKNKMAWKQFCEQGMLVEIEKIIDTIVEENEGYIDGYELTGDLLDMIVSSFPPLKDAWSKMTVDEKWILVEQIYYNIGQRVRELSGFVCVPNLPQTE